ncbi:MAG: hypothetical protein AVDCRST_MAG71-1102, partial [uncultured Lysobacter sp.]
RRDRYRRRIGARYSCSTHREKQMRPLLALPVERRHRARPSRPVCPLRQERGRVRRGSPLVL